MSTLRAALLPLVPPIMVAALVFSPVPLPARAVPRASACPVFGVSTLADF